MIIGGNGDSIFQRLMHAIGRPELAQIHASPTTQAA